ncbi:MAG: hypothetical protein KZQ85_11755 [Candidatus Thiodiazotropha sp. (ex Myrtea sp. 'scaly one' KF741663)]|nr:hypothetical protein [Candidatus Thiodiazotropha sp. (ex Myrtea sp. 'scaly one' KF741663)]
MKTILIVIAIIISLLVLSQMFSTSPVSSDVVQLDGSVIDDDSVKYQSSESDKPSLLVQIIVSWWLYILYYAVGVVFAVFIYRDAKKVKKLVLNIGPVWWGVLAVYEPPLGVLVYWILHYSKLSVEKS